MHSFNVSYSHVGRPTLSVTVSVRDDGYAISWSLLETFDAANTTYYLEVPVSNFTVTLNITRYMLPVSVCPSNVSSNCDLSGNCTAFVSAKNVFGRSAMAASVILSGE
jgi:hypothetical protein